jgi:KDO2-lipid IV(A) lauroyltransferase
MNQLFFFILTLFSRLPLSILYKVSDFLFFLNYYLIGYRKKVVYQNLKNSFPEKTEAEIKEIQKKFFRNFTDFMVETLKTFTISAKKLENIVEYKNTALFQKSFDEKKNLIILSGHNFNWEFTTLVAQKVPQQNFYAIYRKLQSKFWDEKIIESRARFGFKLIEAKNVMKQLKEQPNDGNSVYGFLSDQTPHSDKVQFGLEFLNQKTPAFTGYNRIPGKENMIFCYAEILKIKRGKYHIHFIEIQPENETFEGEELVVKFHKMLEKTIKNHPENWLWTHKKWKYAHTLTEKKLYQGRDYNI